MIQSAAYEILKEEGLEKGLREGLYQAIAMGLEIKFGTKGLILMEKIKR